MRAKSSKVTHVETRAARRGRAACRSQRVSGRERTHGRAGGRACRVVLYYQYMPVVRGRETGRAGACSLASVTWFSPHARSPPSHLHTCSRGCNWMVVLRCADVAARGPPPSP